MPATTGSPRQDRDRHGPARSAHVMEQSDLGYLHLARRFLDRAPELIEHLVGLARSRRADGVAFRLEAAARIDREVPSDLRVSFLEEGTSLALLPQAEVLVGEEF